jgi:virulence-associated protein VagC
MTRTRVFRSGNSQAIRVPASMRFADGQEVDVYQKEGSLCVTPVPKAALFWDQIYGSIPDLERSPQDLVSLRTKWTEK